MFNVVVLHGRLSRPPAERVLPSGDRIATLDLTVAASEDRPSKAESVPLAWFDPPTWVAGLDVGAELVVLGRVRRRFFRGGTGLQSRTEVLIESATPTRRRAKVAEILRRATEALSDGG